MVEDSVGSCLGCPLWLLCVVVLRGLSMAVMAMEMLVFFFFLVAVVVMVAFLVGSIFGW